MPCERKGHGAAGSRAAAGRRKPRCPSRRRPRRQRDERRQGKRHPLPFPAATGNSGKKFFRTRAASKSLFLINILHAILCPNRRRGRETAGKPENPRIASWYRPISAIMFINKVDVFAWPLYGATVGCGKQAAGVVRAARGGKDVRSPISERKRDYEVGFGKPPVHSRFKNGQSGNPRGPRPKSLPALLVDALDEKVVATIGGERREITRRQAVVTQLDGDLHYKAAAILGGGTSRQRPGARGQRPARAGARGKGWSAKRCASAHVACGRR